MGYEKYTYKSFFRNKDQIYIRIADGWDKRPGRYVWGGCRGILELCINKYVVRTGAENMKAKKEVEQL